MQENVNIDNSQKKWKQTKYLLTDRWINKRWYNHETEYYLVMKKEQSTDTQFNINEP